jgi:cell division transport system permease protein
VAVDQLPVPRLVDVQIDPGAAPDLAMLRRQLASVLPEARLDDHRPWLNGMRAAAGRIDAILGAAIAVALGLSAAASIYAIRAGLLVERSAVEVLHLLGAPDADVAQVLAMRYLLLGLLGGVVGAAATVCTVAALGGAGDFIQLPAAMALGGMADWRVWAVLAGVVFAAGLIAMASAQITVLRWLARMP